jgi:uncharacterized protein
MYAIWRNVRMRTSVIERGLLASILTATLLVAVGSCQAPDVPAAPQKPYRERLLERALKGDAEAQFDLAKAYEAGRSGLAKDLSEARRWYRQAADRGDPFAEASLGILFNFGKGVQRDYVQAYMWYDRAASHLREGGDRDSIVEMRDRLVAKLTPAQIAEARRLAAASKPASGQ